MCSNIIFVTGAYNPCMAECQLRLWSSPTDLFHQQPQYWPKFIYDFKLMDGISCRYTVKNIMGSSIAYWHKSSIFTPCNPFDSYYYVTRAYLKFIQSSICAIKWKHFPRNRLSVGGINQSPVDSPHKCQWRGALIFSLICADNRNAGDLRRHRTHFNVTVMVHW